MDNVIKDVAMLSLISLIKEKFIIDRKRKYKKKDILNILEVFEDEIIFNFKDKEIWG